jgi:hypothetical protein
MDTRRLSLVTEGPLLAPWTAEHVCLRMIEAFKALPHVPIYSPRSNVLQTALDQARPADLDLIALSALYLKDHEEERLFLLTWARARAAGRSVRELCREHGWPRETFKRKRKKACLIIADHLNREGVPAF